MTLGFLPALCLAVLAALGVLLARRAGLPWLNPVSVVAAVWTPALLIAGLPGELEPALTATTVGLLLVAWVLFVAGTTLGWRAAGGARDRAALPSVALVPKRPLLLLHGVLTVMLLGFGVTELLTILPIIERLGGIAGLMEGRGVAFRAEQAALRSRQLAQGVSTSSLVLSAAGYGLFLGHAALFTGAVLWRRHRILAVLPLALLAVLSLVTLERTYFVMGLLLFVASLAYLPRRGAIETKRPRSVRRVVILAAAALGVFSVLLVPLLLRNSGTLNSSGLQSLFQYYISGVAGLNTSVGSSASQHLLGAPLAGPGFGSFTFSGLASVLHRLGLPTAPAPDYNYLIVYIGHGEFATNVGTSLADLYFDTGGTIGLLIVVACVSALGGALVVWARRRAWLFPVNAWYVALLMWSFFGNVLTRDLRYIVVVVVTAVVLVTVGRQRRRAGTAEGMPQDSVTTGEQTGAGEPEGVDLPR